MLHSELLQTSARVPIVEQPPRRCLDQFRASLRLLLPDWLETVAKFNPITCLVAALRALVNEGWDWTAIWQALAVTLGLAVVTLTAATRAFRKLIG